MPSITLDMALTLDQKRRQAEARVADSVSGTPPDAILVFIKKKSPENVAVSRRLVAQCP